MYKPTEVDLAYCAGFFDGEGTVSIQEPYHMPRPYFIIANNFLPALESIQTILSAGKIYPPHQFRCYQLFMMKADEIIEVGNLLLPYLKIKIKQVKLGIQLAQVVKECPPRDIPSAQMLLRFRIAEMIKEINQRRGSELPLITHEEACGVNTNSAR